MTDQEKAELIKIAGMVAKTVTQAGLPLGHLDRISGSDQRMSTLNSFMMLVASNYALTSSECNVFYGLCCGDNRGDPWRKQEIPKEAPKEPPKDGIVQYTDKELKWET